MSLNLTPQPQVNILLVDDHPENILSLEAVLACLGENLVTANSGEEALRCLLHQDFAVILLDVQMPGLNGFETADLIRNRSRSSQTPIIFLTAFSTGDDWMFKGYSLGAVDYLHKPIDPVILTSKVSVFVDLFRKTEMIERQRQEVERQAHQLKQVNTDLRQSEERFRLLSSCSPVGIFLLDTNGQCTYTNPRCQDICGFTAEEGLGEGWLQFLHPEDHDRAMADLSQYVHDAQELSYEYRFQAPDGSIRWTRVRTSPMFSAQQALIGHVGTIEDITTHKQAELVREQMLHEQIARQEAETANRMKDEFLAVLSHELRTPLNAILGWSRLLRTRKLDPKTIDRALETIERNATAQSQLIEDILDVSKIIRGKLRLNCLPINMLTVIEAAMDSVRPQAEAKSIDLTLTTDAATHSTWGDAVRLQQVIWNLLSNAIKFTPAGGQVVVRLEQPPVEMPQTTQSPDHSRPDDSSPHAALNWMQIQVSDTGIGINSDFLPHVFDRFRQADSTITRAHNGLGLGLAIVQHLVELHGGTVTAESLGKGQGSTFTVKLPRRDAVQAAVTIDPDAALDTQSLSLDGIKILLVEDEADARDFLSFVLQQYGAVIAVTDSVREALSLLPDFQPDVLISDIAMPGQDGYRLIQQLRTSEQPDDRPLPVIALTAYSSADDQDKALSLGFNAHLGKPVEVHQLIRTIDSVLAIPQVPLRST
jgi:PAS domain S-box-containing protein